VERCKRLPPSVRRPFRHPLPHLNNPAQSLKQDAERIRQQKKTVIWFVWFVSFVWLNKTNKMNETNQMNQINSSRQSRLSRSSRVPR
jgi:hypothetical protein